jgi:hypothetical protein
MSNMKKPVLFLLMVVTCASVSRQDSDQPVLQINATIDEFQKLFKYKRLIQLEAINGLLNLAKYEAKYEMVSRMFDKIFELHDKSWSKIQNSDYIPGGEDSLQTPPLPQDAHVMESLSTLMENCALVGDVVLRLPDISHRLLNKNPEWMRLTRHCFTFCPSTRLMDPVTEEMFNLASQELHLIPRNANFTNPYREKEEKTVKQRKNSRKMEL